MDKIKLKPTDMLVSRLDDYYTKSDKFSITKDDKYIVGVIEAGGHLVSPSTIGSIIYYHKHMAQEINLKGIGNYDLVTESIWLLIREDQDKNNY